MMTPEQARHLINADSRSTHGPLTDCRVCELVKRRAWEMVHQIAGMTYEHGEQHIVIPGRLEHATWGVNPEEVRQLPGYGDHIHIVRRLVSEPEEVPSE